MMKAVVLLIALAAVSCHGLGFPNYNLPCVNYPATFRFASGSIPYCQYSGDFNIFELSVNNVAAHENYKYNFEAVNSNILVTPVITNSAEVAATNVINAVVIAVGPTVPQAIKSAVSAGNTVQLDLVGCFSQILTSAAGIINVGFTFNYVISCPAGNIIGKIERQGQDIQTSEGLAQSLALQRPFTFYGLVGLASTF